MRYKQTIRISANVTDIMQLPCVFSCHKESDGRLCYLLYDWDDHGRYVEAHPGEWLCEDLNGKWHVFPDKDYKRLNDEEKET